MSALSAAKLTADLANDAKRRAAVVQEDSAVKALQRIQDVLAHWRGGTATELGKQIADSGGLWFESHPQR